MSVARSVKGTWFSLACQAFNLGFFSKQIVCQYLLDCQVEILIKISRLFPSMHLNDVLFLDSKTIFQILPPEKPKRITKIWKKCALRERINLWQSTQIRDHSKLAPFGGIFENSTFSESLSFVSILDEFKGVTVSFLLLEKKAKAFFYRIELKKLD